MLEGSSSDEALAAAMKIGSYIYLVLMPLGIVIQLVLCFYALRTFQRRRKSRGPDVKRQRLLLISFMIGVTYSTAVLIEVWNIACRMLGKEAYPAWSLGLSTGLTAGYIFIGDCLMLWRCYAIWNQRKWAALIPAALLLTSISRFYSQTYRAALGIVTAVGSVSHWHDIPPLLAILWVAFSVATNLSVTSLIIYKLLVARREVVNSEMYAQAPRFYRDMIIILVESAAPLAMAGVCAATVSATRLANGLPAKSMAKLYLFVLVSHLLFLLFGALSPQMILFRTLVCAPKGLVVQGDDSESNGPSGAGLNSQSAQFSTVQYIA
ncbi:hypothetical protein BKA70DRAFT_1489398 [Coprinopsis sp. MPI-PUGE-AT-0042]|nr:hypothetical protein BKA70DRAFT_1489398 [Coprinopsis sp. MPI-PUGE-AT-0042]